MPNRSGAFSATANPTKPNAANNETTVTVPITLGIVVMHHNFVAEETGSFRPPVGDQGLVFGELQLEAIAQEPSHHVLDTLGFPSRTGESQQPIVRIADVMQPSETRVMRVSGRESLQLPTQLSRFLPLPILFQFPGSLVYPHIRKKRLTSVSPVVDGQEGCLDIPVKPVQVDIREQGA